MKWLVVKLVLVLSLSLFFLNGGVSAASKDSDETVKPLPLSLDALIRLVKEKNERIIFQELEWGVSREAVNSEKAIFEPDFVASLQHEKNAKRNTAEEFIARSSTLFQGGDPSVFNERNNDYSAAVEGLTPLGTRVRLGYTLQDISSNLTDHVAPGIRQYQTFLGGSLEQPLLKNRGIDATTAGIRIAEFEADVAFQGYRQELMGVVFDAASGYWDLVRAQDSLRIRRDSVQHAEVLLKQNREWAKFGRIAETEVLEAEAGLAVRKSLAISAKQDLVSAMNRLRTLFSSSAAHEDATVRAVDPLRVEPVSARLAETLQKAFELRPEYLSSQKKIKREGIRIAYAKNQRWPQLDLKSSYGINGLDSSADGSWQDAKDREFESWAVGLEFRIPIGGGKKTRSELEAAKKKKQQALLEMKAVEVAVANAADTAVKNLRHAYEQVLKFENAVRLRERLLRVEVARFDAGKSNSRILLEREEDLLEAKEAWLESRVNFKKSELNLGMAKGSLLLTYGIEIMEVTE